MSVSQVLPGPAAAGFPAERLALRGGADAVLLGRLPHESGRSA